MQGRLHSIPQLNQRLQLFVRDRRSLVLGWREFLIKYAGCSQPHRAIFFRNHPFTYAGACRRSIPLQRKLIRNHRAVDETRCKTRHYIHHNLIVAPRDGMDRIEHAGGTGVEYRLNDHCHRRRAVAPPDPLVIGCHLLVPQRRPDRLHRGRQLRSGNSQHCVVQPREAGVSLVFIGGRGSDGPELIGRPSQ